MTQRSLLIATLIATLSLSSITKPKSDSADALVAGIVGGIAAGVVGYLVYDYCTCDSRLVNNVEKFCSKHHDDSLAHQAFAMLSDQKQVTLLMSSHPASSKYRSMIRNGIDELQELEQESIRYFNKLKNRRECYSSRDNFYHESARLQQALKGIELKCLELRALLTVGTLLAESSDLIDTAIALCNKIAVLHQPALSRINEHELQHCLSGHDNLKEYWLLLNETINNLTNNLERLTKERLEMSRILSHASALGTPYSLRAAGEQQIAQLQASELELITLIHILQRLQGAVGTHPRYGHDNDLYMVDYTRKLVTENQNLKDRISDMQRSINNLEYEKRSLYSQISSLKDSIKSLEWQVAMSNNRPSQPNIIIAQQK